MFGGILCDLYKAGEDILMTRKQIGESLGYADPQKAIDNLHSKHRNRLDKYSVTLEVRGADGKLYDTALYSTKGIYEVCRWSKQEKANGFVDWLWDVVESIRKTGSYTLNDIVPMLDTITKRLEASEANNANTQASLDKLNDNIAIRRYQDPKAMLKALDVRYGAVIGNYYTRGFYDAIANYLGIPVPKGDDIPKGMHLWEYIIAKLPMDHIESFVIGVEHGTIVKSKAKNWVNLNGYAADRQWDKILESFGHTCAYCGKSHYVSTLVAEHIVAQSTIAQFDVDSCHLPQNIVPSCPECNHSKYTHPMELWYKHQPFYDEQRYQKILRHIAKYLV